MMRAWALSALLLLSAPLVQQEAPEEDSRCHTRCAAVDRDVHGFKSCSCDARKGIGCNPDGTRAQENMANCVNRQHCLRGCCHCCPKD